MEPCWLTNRQIEAGRVALTRAVKRGGKIWIRVFPDKPFTKKPAETRMGKGKGNPEYWVAVIRPGRILYEMEGATPEVAREAFRLAGNKLPIRTKIREPGGHVGHGQGQGQLEKPERGELQQRTRELGEEVFNLRFQVSMSMAKNPARIGAARRRSPRTRTILRERQLGLVQGRRTA